jgi:hypothetical protein
MAGTLHTIRLSTTAPFTFKQGERRYALGFKMRHDAIRVQQSLSKDLQIHVVRRHVDDVTREVNDGLMLRGHSLKVDRVTIDPEALIAFPKERGLHPYTPASFDTAEVCASDFMMMPFIHQTGIAMPYELVADDDDRIVFRAHVVDPGMSLEAFRQHLRRSM